MYCIACAGFWVMLNSQHVILENGLDITTDQHYNAWLAIYHPSEAAQRKTGRKLSGELWLSTPLCELHASGKSYVGKSTYKYTCFYVYRYYLQTIVIEHTVHMHLGLLARARVRILASFTIIYAALNASINHFTCDFDGLDDISS